MSQSKVRACLAPPASQVTNEHQVEWIHYNKD